MEENNNFQNRNKNRKKKHRYHNKKNHIKNEMTAETAEDAALEEMPIEIGAEIGSPDIIDTDPSFDLPVSNGDTLHSSEEDTPSVDVVGIRFNKAGKVYYFDPKGITVKKGDSAIVETARGLEFGEVWIANTKVCEKDIIPPLRPLVRIATEDDKKHNEENKKKEEEAFTVCIKKINSHGLDMKLVDVQFTFDNSKLLFYFTSSGRVDFRELVKDLASVFRTRIELRQIGIRDEAKLMGGLGACGRPLCCASFLSDFVQVSIKMAKEQGLSLNSAKISGVCGRLMCCLRYEHDTYTYEISKTPPVDSVVKTEDGIGTVIETSPLSGTIKVKLNDKNDIQPKVYHRDNVKIISVKQENDKN